MKISICTPIYNNWNFTKAYLKDLSKLPDDCEVIVVNNGSSDQTLKEYDNAVKHKNSILINNPDNKGFAKASNQAYEVAKGEFVIFLNNDIRVQNEYSEWVNILTKAADKANLSSPTIGYLDSHFNFLKESDVDEDFNYKYLSGWCLCGQKVLLDKFILPDNEFKGPFTEEFITYFEDTDLSFRARQQQVSLKLVKIPVIHFGKVTSRTLGISKLYMDAKTKFVNKWLGKI